MNYFNIQANCNKIRNFHKSFHEWFVLIRVQLPLSEFKKKSLSCSFVVKLKSHQSHQWCNLLNIGAFRKTNYYLKIENLIKIYSFFLVFYSNEFSNSLNKLKDELEILNNIESSHQQSFWSKNLFQNKGNNPLNLKTLKSAEVNYFK